MMNRKAVKATSHFSIRCALMGITALLLSSQAKAGCELVVDGKKTPFNGQIQPNTLVEKKSLVKLDKQYPNLNVVEKTFKGDIITCSNCTDKYLICEN